MRAGCLLFAFLFAGLAAAQPANKYSSEFLNVDLTSNVDVIVQYDQVPTAAHHQKVLNRGGQLKQTLNLVKAGAYRMPASAIADLATDPSVVHISLDQIRPVKMGTVTGHTWPVL